MNESDNSAAGWRCYDLAAIQALVEGRHADPFAVLGPHATEHGTALRVLRPGAETATAIDAASGKPCATMLRRHPDGFFEGLIPRDQPVSHYVLRYTRGDDRWEEEDAYAFPSGFGELDLHLIGEGRHARLVDLMGAHPREINGVQGIRFAVWAPNATRASVIGEFNDWDGRRHPMRRHPGIGAWEIFIPGITLGARYKFELVGPHGELLPAKADPFAFAAEKPPATASVVHGLPKHAWRDADWMEQRAARQQRGAPISIYEVHLGSWRRREGNAELSYEQLGDQLIPYALDMGFTHIECMPVSEHPFSGSWGYQPISLYAPTARFGDPEGFAEFVDRCHAAGLGVIIDWVPAHFPSDAHGLARFDGTALYEHEDPRLGFHRDWNTLIYNFGRHEVANFLRANALFWLQHYHIDALRVDAVASMLHLDYSREAGEWVPNIHGGNENLEAVRFLSDMNIELFSAAPGATSFAEESTAWSGVSRPVHDGGLGFGYKWNMGWMHDTLDYMQREPVYRCHHHGQLTFGLVYAFSENFVLPLSHDEVVHGKGSLLGKMPGDRWQKFANLRAYYGFMWSHPGKKLLFMGCEFAQEREWNHDMSLDWHLVDDGMHRGVQALVRDLNRAYREEPALHAMDCESAGFEWIDASDSASSIYVYMRKGHEQDRPVVVICNFTPVARHDYRIGLPFAGEWRELLNTDAREYGGSGVRNDRIEAHGGPWQGRQASAELSLPPLATLLLVPGGTGS